MNQGNKNVILNMKFSDSERHLAVLVGRKTLNRTNLITHLIILEQDEINQTYLFRYFRKLPSKIKDSCIQFEFLLDNNNEILFTDRSQIFKYNFMNLELKQFFKFKELLNC